jgi:hypothetical protein
MRGRTWVPRDKIMFRQGIGMGKTLVVILSCMLLISSPAWGQDAMYFYNLGLENSMANKKIHYFSKAGWLSPTRNEGCSTIFRGNILKCQEIFRDLQNSTRPTLKLI